MSEKTGFVGGGLQRGRSLLCKGSPEGKLPAGWKHPMKPGFRGRGFQRGQRSIWHTILLARSSVLHLGRWAGVKGACGMAAQDAFEHAGQAVFAGGTAGKDEACETQKPPGRQRMCGLGWSGATGKHKHPRRPRCIKALVSRLSLLAFCFSRRGSVFRFWFSVHTGFAHFLL